MSLACSGAAGALAFAAAPVFAGMAALTLLLGGGQSDMLCPAAASSPLTGMAAMYLLMGALHAGPWLDLLARRPGAD